MPSKHTLYLLSDDDYPRQSPSTDWPMYPAVTVRDGRAEIIPGSMSLDAEAVEGFGKILLIAAADMRKEVE